MAGVPARARRAGRGPHRARRGRVALDVLVRRPGRTPGVRPGLIGTAAQRRRRTPGSARRGGVVGPGVLGVAAPQLGPDLAVGAVPEAGQVLVTWAGRPAGVSRCRTSGTRPSATVGCSTHPNTSWIFTAAPAGRRRSRRRCGNRSAPRRASGARRSRSRGWDQVSRGREDRAEVDAGEVGPARRAPARCGRSQREVGQQPLVGDVRPGVAVDAVEEGDPLAPRRRPRSSRRGGARPRSATPSSKASTDGLGRRIRPRLVGAGRAPPPRRRVRACDVPPGLVPAATSRSTTRRSPSTASTSPPSITARQRDPIVAGRCRRPLDDDQQVGHRPAVVSGDDDAAAVDQQVAPVAAGSPPGPRRRPIRSG